MRQSRKAAQAECISQELPGLEDRLTLRSQLPHSSPETVLNPCLCDDGDHGRGDVPWAGWSPKDAAAGRRLGACTVVASMTCRHRGGDSRDLDLDLSAPMDKAPFCRRRDDTGPPLWNVPCRNSYHEGTD